MTPTAAAAAAAAAAAPTTVNRDLAEDDIVRGGGCKEEEGAAASPPPPSTPATNVTTNSNGAFLLPCDGSLVGTTIAEYRSVRLEHETRERTMYSTTTGMCKGYARCLHRRLPEALLRVAPSKKKVVVYQHARLVRAGNIDWWDEMTNDYEGGGIPMTGTTLAQMISCAGVRLSSCLCYWCGPMAPSPPIPSPSLHP